MEEICRRIRSLVTDITRVIEEDCLSMERLDSITTSAERLLRAFVMVLNSDSTDMMEECVRAVQDVVTTLNTMISNMEDTRAAEPYGYYLSLSFTGGRGRPKLNITAGVLNYFVSHGFSASSIAMLLHVSLSTIRRRMREYGISIRDQYSTLSDTELDRMVTSVQHSNPNCGYRLMRGYLARLGHRVQQSRIRESMARTDPIGVISRWCNTVQRRQYSVASPNHLWHIDGNHRLIRYNLLWLFPHNIYIYIYKYNCYKSQEICQVISVHNNVIHTFMHLCLWCPILCSMCPWHLGHPWHL